MRYAAVVRGNLAKAFELTNTQVLRHAALPKSYTDRLGRKLFLALLTVQGLGAFALITLGVILKKFRTARSVVQPRVRQEISRAGSALMPLFIFVALALGFVVVGQAISVLAKTGQTNYLGDTMVIVWLFAFLQDVSLTPGDYFKQIAGALGWLDFALLALKTVTFGFFIAIVTCYHGLAQPLRLEDVSRVAVRAVTQGVVVCVLVDAVFIVLYLVT